MVLSIPATMGSIFDYICTSTDTADVRHRFLNHDPILPHHLPPNHYLLSQAIAGLFVRKPAEQHQCADAVYRLLTCSSPSEMEKYLSHRGIPWKAPASPSEAEVTHLDDEFSDFVTDSQIEPEMADATRNDEANRDSLVVEEVIKNSITNRLSTSYSTSNANFSLDSKEKDSNLNSFSFNAMTLPPVQSVTPLLLEPLDDWSPRDPNSSRTGRKGLWTPSTSINEERDRDVGQHGEEIIFLQEVERVKKRGYQASRVVWVAQNNPAVDYDILSVDENGRDLWIEVKSTTGRHGHFQWSIAELKKAIQERELYILWRIYEADTTHPGIKPFRDPIGKIIRKGVEAA
jgi:hypothetical protein